MAVRFLSRKTWCMRKGMAAGVVVVLHASVRKLALLTVGMTLILRQTTIATTAALTAATC